MSAPKTGDAAFRYTEDGQDYLHHLGHPLFQPVADIAQIVHAFNSADLTTRRVIAIGSGVQDLTAMIRWDGMTESLRRFIAAARRGASLEYFPSMARPSESYPCTLISDGGVSLDNDFWWNRRNSVQVTLRRTDGGSWVGLTEGTLFYYVAGNDMPGLTFTRAGSVGPYVDEDGVLQNAAADIFRTDWLDTDGDLRMDLATLLLEDARTNAWTWSEDFGDSGDAAWTKTGATITDDATTAPDGASTADELVESGVNEIHELRRNLVSPTDDTDQAVSWFVRANTRDWCAIVFHRKDNTFARVWFDLANGEVGTVQSGIDLYEIKSVGAGWFRVSASADTLSGGTTASARLRLATGDGVNSYAGDGSSGIYVWGAQNETDAAVTSSYIATDGSTDSRGVEFFQVDIGFTPADIAAAGGLTAFTEFYAGGTALGGVAGRRWWHIGGAGAGSDPRMGLYSTATAGQIRSDFDDGTAQVTSTSGAVITAMGQLVRVRTVIRQVSGTWRLQTHTSVAGGAEASASESNIGSSLPPSWSANTLTVGSDPAGNSVGFTRMRRLKMTGGVKTMAEMAAL